MADRHDAYVDDALSARGYEVNRRRSPGFFPSKHWHDGVELVVVHGGAVEFHYDGRRDLVAPGEAYVINGALPHSARVLSGRLDRTVLHFRPELTRFAPGRSVIGSVYKDGLGYKVGLPGASIRRLAWVARELRALAHESMSRGVVEGLLGLAVAELESASAAPGPPRPPILNAVIDYMESNVSSSETLPDIAARFAVSPKTLFNLFKAHMNCSPKLYWTKVRLQEGRRLLCDTPWTVECVALHTGFRSARGFEQAFRRHLGMSPSEYRRRYAGR